MIKATNAAGGLCGPRHTLTKPVPSHVGPCELCGCWGGKLRQLKDTLYSKILLLAFKVLV